MSIDEIDCRSAEYQLNNDDERTSSGQLWAQYDMCYFCGAPKSEACRDSRGLRRTDPARWHKAHRPMRRPHPGRVLLWRQPYTWKSPHKNRLEKKDRHSW